MATVNDVIMLTIVFLTCGYHVEFGLALKNENSAIVDGNTTANSGERELLERLFLRVLFGSRCVG
jgi:hypothetical protein